MPSLVERQRTFVAAILDEGIASDAPDARVAIYRRAVLANYRKALAATYPVVRRLVGVPFFNAAVDRYVMAVPSTSGDLNVYGDRLGEFLDAYEPAVPLPYLGDVARLEWAIDEANRAPDVSVDPQALLTALSSLPASRLPSLRLTLSPSCRLIDSRFPVLGIWQVNQPQHAGDMRVDLEANAERLLVRRDPDGVALELTDAGEHAWLAALAADAMLGEAIEAAQRADAAFDLASVLRKHLAAGAIIGFHA